MSTFYHLAKEKDHNKGKHSDLLNEFGIDEMSNELSLVCCGNDQPWIATNSMTPEEMAKIFLAGLTGWIQTN